MPEWLWYVAIVAAYLILMKWVLPALGAPT